jgi:hypothetical protein
LSDTIIKLENISKQYRLGHVGTWWLNRALSLSMWPKSHPELTGRENIFLNGDILGMTKAEIFSKFETEFVMKDSMSLF